MVEEREVPLDGGNTSDGVVRVGETVRKPWGTATSAVFEFMAAVRAENVDVPVALGRDDRGRQITEFVPGCSALHAPPLSLSGLHRVGRIVRAIHDASEGFTPTVDAPWDVVIPAPSGELICHNDLAPWNLIIGDRWVFIDWDGAGPSSRVWDLAYAAQAFTLSVASEVPEVAATRLAALIDGYGADQNLRQQLPGTMVLRARAMYELLHSSHRSGREPWASMFASGHGRHWHTATEYVERHQQVWSRALLSHAC